MPTYRVYLRRATTDPSQWDWIQDIIAADIQLVTHAAYINWVKSAPDTGVPRLVDCQSLVTEIDID